MSKYTIVEKPKGTYRLMQDGEYMGLPTKSALQFWQEREAFRKALKAAMSIWWMAEKWANHWPNDREYFNKAVKETLETLETLEEIDLRIEE